MLLLAQNAQVPLGANSITTQEPPSQNLPASHSIPTALALFAVGFILTAALIHSFMPNGLNLYANMRSEKLVILNQWSGRASSASFGSSHVHYGFDPRTFDAILADSPERTHTVNLAIAGGSQSEQRATALAFLAGVRPPPSETPQACIIVLELGAGANFTNDHLIHPRAINVYDWDTLRFITTLVSPQLGSVQRIGRLGYAAAATVLHYTSVGMLSNVIFNPPIDRTLLASESDDDRRGLIVEPMRPGVLDQLKVMLSTAPARPEVKAGVLLPGNRGLADELTARAGVHPLNIVYVLMPKVSDLWQTTVYPDSIKTNQGSVPIINLAQPNLYPQLYRPALWFDDAHLNEAGAKVATTILAEELKHWYALHGQPAPCGR